MYKKKLKKINRRIFLFGSGIFLLSFFPFFKNLNAKTRTQFKITCGSCISQDRKQPIWKSILKERSNAFIFMGDNVYGDDKKNGKLELLKKAYEKQKEKIPFKKLEETNEIFSIWDDHDYGKNDGGSEFPYKKQSKELFLKFWGIPLNDARRSREGIYFKRKRKINNNFIQLIFLDTRYFRSPLKPTDEKWMPTKERYIPDNDPSKTYLGEKQWKWLNNSLKEKADIRFIVSSIQVIADGHGYEKWGNLPMEKLRLFNLIDKNNINNLIILSGDRHRGGIYKEKTNGGNQLFELTSSSLNLPAGKLFKSKEELGPNRIGSTFLEENYGVVEINDDKKITLSIKGLDQKTHNKININLS